MCLHWYPHLPSWATVLIGTLRSQSARHTEAMQCMVASFKALGPYGRGWLSTSWVVTPICPWPSPADSCVCAWEGGRGLQQNQNEQIWQKWPYDLGDINSPAWHSAKREDLTCPPATLPFSGELLHLHSNPAVQAGAAGRKIQPYSYLGACVAHPQPFSNLSENLDCNEGKRVSFSWGRSPKLWS